MIRNVSLNERNATTHPCHQSLNLPLQSPVPRSRLFQYLDRVVFRDAHRDGLVEPRRRGGAAARRAHFLRPGAVRTPARAGAGRREALDLRVAAGDLRLEPGDGGLGLRLRARVRRSRELALGVERGEEGGGVCEVGGAEVCLLGSRLALAGSWWR